MSQYEIHLHQTGSMNVHGWKLAVNVYFARRFCESKQIYYKMYLVLCLLSPSISFNSAVEFISLDCVISVCWGKKSLNSGINLTDKIEKGLKTADLFRWNVPVYIWCIEKSDFDIKLWMCNSHIEIKFYKYGDDLSGVISVWKLGMNTWTLSMNFMSNDSESVNESAYKIYGIVRMRMS